MSWTATGYNIDLRDMRFVLFEQLRAHETLKGIDRYAEFDQETYETMLATAAEIAKGPLASCNRAGDKVGCKLDGEGNVTTAPGFREAFRAIAESGLLSTGMSQELGGLGLPHVVNAAIEELLSGANTALNIYAGLSRGAANVLASKYCPEDLKQIVVPKLISGEWSGTMCLTEAGAGSNVGANRAKAEPTGEPGVYHLTGEKIFISGGDNDFTENIVHLVLARTPGAPNGTKGISIFLVPKFLFSPDGTLGARNDAKVVGIEHKMGINGSATCTLALGAQGTCVGYLLGEELQGMEIMFHMMNEARIGVGIQSLGLAQTSYLNALAYSKERYQGSRLDQMGDNNAAQVTINKHPDVRRMLATQKVYVETLRSLIYSVANRLDRSAHSTSEDQDYLLGLVELMTPIIKAHGSDIGYEVCTLALQTFGGYGYIGEYPVEQNLRDVKISSIYEGTNGIQAMDLLGRKMRRKGGLWFMNWLDECNQELERARATGAFAEEVSALEKARDQLGQTAMYLGGLGMEGKITIAMLHSYPFLTLFGTVVLGLHALWQARIAHTALAEGATGDDVVFYKGKLMNARFYAKNILPRATALAKTIQSGDDSCMADGIFD